MTVDNQRLLQYGLYGLGVVVWYVVWRFMGSIIEIVSLAMHQATPEIPIFGTLGNVAALVALALTVAAVEYARRNAVSNRFGLEVVSELRKVTWPNWKDVRGTTLVVVGVTLAVSLILLVFDKIYDGLMKLLYMLA